MSSDDLQRVTSYSHFDSELTEKQGASNFDSRLGNGKFLLEDIARPERIQKWLETGGDPNFVPPSSFDYSSMERSLLHWAAMFKMYESALILVESGASLLAKDGNGQTPLDLAKAAGAEQSCPNLVLILSPVASER